MRKLLCLLLIVLIFGSISCGIKEEWEKAKQTCAKIKSFLQKYGIYDDVVNLLNKGAKVAAKNVCMKKFSSSLCDDIINVAARVLKQIL